MVKGLGSKLLKGGLHRGLYGNSTEVIAGETGSLDYSSCSVICSLGDSLGSLLRCQASAQDLQKSSAESHTKAVNRFRRYITLHPKPNLKPQKQIVVLNSALPIILAFKQPQPSLRKHSWTAFVWVAVKELKLSYYIGETLLFTIYTHYGNLI